METKRLILAIVLSVAVFLGWQYFTIQLTGGDASLNTSNATVATPQTLSNPSADNPSAPAVPKFKEEAPILAGKSITVTTPLYKAVFNSHGGILEEFDLLKYKSKLDVNSASMNLVSQMSKKAGPMGLFVNGVASWSQGEWHVDHEALTLGDGESGTLRFVGTIDGTVVTRELVFDGGVYTINERTTITTPEKKVINVSYSVGASPLAILDSPSIFAKIKYELFGGTKPAPEESSMNMTRVAWLKDGSFNEEASTSTLAGKDGAGMLIKDVSWVGVMNNYFLGSIILPTSNATALVKFSDGLYRIAIGNTQITATPDAPAVMQSSYYFGPKETKALASAPGDLSKALNYGMFTVIAKPLVYLLQFLESYVGNFGVAIILLTVVVKALLWPISLKGYRSMEKMRKIQPLMQEVREKFSNDKEKMNQEMMALYKRHKVNPAGGCLPIFLQIPVFFALYQVLLNSIELRHASFVDSLPFTQLPWLNDLAGPDPYLITPLVMGVTMFIQQKLTPTPGDPTQAKVMLFMPVIFTFMFFNFPAGLVLYWLTNNIISIAQQWWQMRLSNQE